MDVTQGLAQNLEQLATKAEELQDTFFGAWREENKNREDYEKGRIGVRVEPRKEKGTGRITGVRIFWVKFRKPYASRNQGPRGRGEDLPTYSDHIKKGRSSFWYTRAQIQKHAQPWEADLIMDFEHDFGHIRKAVYYLGRAKASYRTVEEALEKLDLNGEA